jgi:transcriptional regulator with XRE-family HTH domain
MATTLKRLRRQRGLTQQGLAVKAGVSLGYIARLEIGMHDPRLSTLRKLAKALRVPEPPETGEFALEGSRPRVTVTRVAETWQFFAFVFAALVTLALALLDEMPDGLVAWRITAKLVAFVVLAYLTLFNIRARNWLTRFLSGFKEERG